MRHLLLGISVLLVLVSCEKKELPTNVTDEPDFYLSGSVDGQDYKESAGDNAYYMYTGAQQDGLGVWEYSGSLKQEGCVDGCTRSVTVKFRETRPGRVPVEVLKVGSVDYKIDDTRPTYTIEFDPSETFTSNANEVNFNWDFGDGTRSEEEKPVHTFTSDKPYYDVCLNVTTSKGVPSQVCSRVYLTTACKTGFELEYGGNVIQLKAVHTGGRESKYLWEFADGTTATTPTLEMVHDKLVSTEQVCLTITDNLGCVSQSCQNIIVNEDRTFTSANFSTNITENVPDNGDLQLNTVVVEYADEFGEFYSTDLNPQDEAYAFKVLSVEEYSDANAQSTPVKRMQVLFSCDVYSADGKKRHLDNMTGWIGVAYPL